jgi:hypothetical protein
MIKSVDESRYTGRFWWVRSFLLFWQAFFSYPRHIVIGLELNPKTGEYDMRVLYHRLAKGEVGGILRNFVEFDQASTRNLESIDKRVIRPE